MPTIGPERRLPVEPPPDPRLVFTRARFGCSDQHASFGKEIDEGSEMCRRAARLHGHGIPFPVEAAATQWKRLEGRGVQVTGDRPTRKDCDAQIRLDHFDDGLGEIHAGNPRGG
jgi:hypothetical protein